MNRCELLAIVERLHDVEIDILERDELAEVVAATARIRGWLDATELRCTRRGRKLADAGQAEPARSMLARNGNRSNRDANQIDRRNKAAEAMPSFEHGLGDGTLSAGHLDAIANATRNASPDVRAAFAAHEDELHAFALGDSIETFTRRCRALVAQLTAELTGSDASELDRQRADSRIRRWVDSGDGMHHTHVALDPLRDEIFWNAINRSVRRRQQRDGNARTPWNQMQVDGLIDAVQGGATDDPRRRRSTSAPTAGRATASTAASRTAPTAAPATAPTAAPATAPAPAPTTGPDPTTSTRPPSPAADIARDLVDAIDRATAHAGEPDDEDHDEDCDEDHDGDHDEDYDDVDTAPSNDVDDHDDHDDDAESDVVLRLIEQRLPEISVLVDLATLVNGLHDHGICETEDGHPLPVSTMRRLCCDAEIIPIVLGADGVPLDLGRTARTVNRAQRRALRAMHRTCANPDCSVPFSHTKIHHVQWWVRDEGPTDIDNLVPLCERCHHLVHEGGWTLTTTPDRVATWTRPDGTIHHHGPCADRHPPTGSPPNARPS